MVRKLVYEQVHGGICWESLRAQLRMPDVTIKYSAAEIDDIVPILADMTDQELARPVTIIKSEPNYKPLYLVQLKAQGFGFCALAEKIQTEEMDSSRLYHFRSDASFQHLLLLRLGNESCE